MKAKREIISAVSLAGLVMFLIILSMRLWKYDLNVPFYYVSDEAQKGYEMVQRVCSAAPDELFSTAVDYGISDVSDIPMYFFSPLYILEIKIVYSIVKSIGMALNLVFLINIYLTAFVSYAVMRKLKLSNFTSILASAVFALSSFVFVQETYYNGMSMCCFVPLALLMCVWVMEDETFFDVGSGFIRNKRTIASLIFMVLIAATGSGYYLLFTCIMLFIAGVSVLIKTKKIKAVIAPLALSFEAVVLWVLYTIPLLTGSADVAYIDGNAIEQSEVLGLKLFQFFVPNGSAHINMLADYIQKYAEKTIYLNENAGAYLGPVGIVGFVILVLTMLTAMNQKSRLWISENGGERMRLYCELLLGLMLFGETGGFGTMAVLFTGIRLVAFNRVCIFIAFICIIAAAMLLDLILKKLSDVFSEKKVLNRLIRFAFAMCTFGFVCLSVLTQMPDRNINYMERSAAKYELESGVVNNTTWTELGKQVNGL